MSQEKKKSAPSPPSEGEIVEAEMKELPVEYPPGYRPGEIALQKPSQNFLPALSVDQAIARYDQMKAFVTQCLDKGIDYGRIPGTKKDTLYKAGAEKLTTFFGLRVTFVDDGTIERFDGDDPFFYYRRICQLWKGDMLIAAASGSANSKEGRYRWRWAKADELDVGHPDTEKMLGATYKKRGGKEGVFEWQYEKRTTSGQYAKDESYWQMIDQKLADGTAIKRNEAQPWNGEIVTYIEWESYEYRVPNDDIFTLVNTILKMAEKRALVAATLIGCNASDYFTQDMEDIQSGVEVSDSPSFQEIEEKSEDPQTVIANAHEMMKTGSFTGNDYLQLGEALGFEKDEVMSVMQSHRSKDKDGRQVTDFAAAGMQIVKEYEEING